MGGEGGTNGGRGQVTRQGAGPAGTRPGLAVGERPQQASGQERPGRPPPPGCGAAGPGLVPASPCPQGLGREWQAEAALVRPTSVRARLEATWQRL